MMSPAEASAITDEEPDWLQILHGLRRFVRKWLSKMS